MRISFKRGNIKYLLISGLIYFMAVFVIPSILPTSINVYTRLNIVLALSIAATIILGVYSCKITNDIEHSGKRYNFLILFTIGLIGFMAMMFLQGAVNYILQYLAKFFEFQTTSKNTSNVVEIIKRMPIFVLYVTVLGPIMEELFFRKAVFGYFYDIFLGSKSWIRFTIPAVITGIVFALPHDGFSPLMLIYIVMSIVFSYLYTLTKSIITPMVAHIFMNILVVVVQIFLGA
ncbi:CAAX amino terminal protease family protein [Gemella bergeri ATCC 700627]|uniref:CAAX amino terminal protease family protein n=1 Tax=Gemella bergeri ATCC 700627 TaxID=1321820 RepID=U2SAK7_9BACL|nr:type II CAAX endopeptidase family protein [Gemella bergeri]ERK59812.1 CAAX amino terminal protease family protein [Gemella bergeri ATCC 700627]